MQVFIAYCWEAKIQLLCVVYKFCNLPDYNSKQKNMHNIRVNMNVTVKCSIEHYLNCFRFCLNLKCFDLSLTSLFV